MWRVARPRYTTQNPRAEHGGFGEWLIISDRHNAVSGRQIQDDARAADSQRNCRETKKSSYGVRIPSQS